MILPISLPSRRFGLALALACVLMGLLVAVATHPAFAQARNPFSVGISEGGGSASGLTGWLLQEQALFERQLSAAVRAAKADGSAVWTLMGLSFVYGVFHAAGPGHGKAVMTSYLFANERALRRGLVLSLLAALLQGLVAILLVGVLALVLHATAQRMKDAASFVESLSYAGIAVLGAWLVWQKGGNLIRTLRAPHAPSIPARIVPAPPHHGSHGATPAHVHAHAHAHTAHGPNCTHAHDNGDHHHHAAPLSVAALGHHHVSGEPRHPERQAGQPHVHGPDCGHYHAPDPATLGEGFSWREAILTVMAAGSRPCSGAILVLVFALAQGLFAAGVAATFAMSLGTAITTGALACLAVLAKTLTVRLSSPGSRRGLLVVHGLETLAALLVLGVGLSLFMGATSLGGA